MNGFYDIKFRFYQPHKLIKMSRTYDLFDLLEEGWLELGRNPHDNILRRYTGVKDKNGVEIYEGDIVDGATHEKNHLVVMWDKDDCRFCVRDTFEEEEWTYSEKFCRTKGGDYDYGFNVWKVIGNVWENPELLHNEEKMKAVG